MKTIFALTLKSALRDPFLLFWSLILPIGGSVLLGYFINVEEYPLHIMTGMIAASILFYSLVTTAYSIMAHRRRGVYNLLLVTPMKLWQYIVSLSSAWTLIAVISGLIVMAVCCSVFVITISFWSILLIVPVLFLSAIGFVFISFFVSSLAKNEGQMSIITNILLMPMLFCSDAFYSLVKAPGFLLIVSKFNPFQWFVEGVRNAFAVNLSNYAQNMGFLILFFLIALALAIKTFRYSDK